MQFPLSREDLLNYRNNKYKAAADSKVKSIVESVCAGVMDTVEKTAAHRYVYPAEHDLVFSMQRSGCQKWPTQLEPESTPLLRRFLDR